ncbi:hypothetical protein J2Y86_004317 [Pseudomonas migulae]|jgi:hypothetical protein|uniref:hypothetical protein n=1 Tax=Pseudomonas migulae TaxID=78543 RepID=UPI0020A1982B|nr:hypothetical protein [Pseudomonas migulae]MCP1499610.1 hypothetical protein [Pseudomonas migulae]
MFDYLLNEKNFSSLNEYTRFLNDLPATLNEIQRFSKSFQSQGHVMMTPPSASLLTQAATMNALCWRAVQITVPQLAFASGRVVTQVSTLLEEFREELRKASGPARRMALQDIDPRRFTPAGSNSAGTNRPRDVVVIMRNLVQQLEGCERASAQFKSQIVQIAQTIHSIFVRFIESLSMRLCICDGPVSKIEAYYSLGHFGLPVMHYDPQAGYSLEQRLEKAREHLQALFGMYAQATSAANNLGDFCHRMNFYLNVVKTELLFNDGHQTLARANLSLATIVQPIEELRTMSNGLLRLSSKLQ